MQKAVAILVLASSLVSFDMRASSNLGLGGLSIGILFIGAVCYCRYKEVKAYDNAYDTWKEKKSVEICIEGEKSVVDFSLTTNQEVYPSLISENDVEVFKKIQSGVFVSQEERDKLSAHIQTQFDYNNQWQEQLMSDSSIRGAENAQQFTDLCKTRDQAKENLRVYADRVEQPLSEITSHFKERAQQESVATTN